MNDPDISKPSFTGSIVVVSGILPICCIVHWRADGCKSTIADVRCSGSPKEAAANPREFTTPSTASVCDETMYRPSVRYVDHSGRNGGLARTTVFDQWSHHSLDRRTYRPAQPVEIVRTGLI